MYGYDILRQNLLKPLECCKESAARKSLHTRAQAETESREFNS